MTSHSDLDDKQVITQSDPSVVFDKTEKITTVDIHATDGDSKQVLTFSRLFSKRVTESAPEELEQTTISPAPRSTRISELPHVSTRDYNVNDHSNTSSVILSPTKLENAPRKRVLQNETVITNNQTTLDNTEEQKIHKKPYFERRKIFNITKHVVAILFIILDLIFDWIEYFEMNERGNYSIVAERRLKNLGFTYECQGTGEHIQFIFLIFTVVSSILTVLQILNIIYQVFYEMKGVYEGKKLFNETLETFVFLLFIETSQMLLILGFYDVCTLDCIINRKKIIIVLIGVFSILRVSWRFVTQWRCCTFRLVTPSVPKRNRSPITIENQHRPINTAKTKCCGDLDICPSNISKYCLITFVPLLLPCLLIWFIFQKCCSKNSKWKCEHSFRCCILRCFPSRFQNNDTNACDCMCRKCLSFERPCKICTFRCFPSFLDNPKEDVCECTCGRAMRCQQMCGCCILRCFPSYFDPPEPEICKCRFGCMAFERPCKCFVFRCFPKYLDTPHPDICTCRCAECMAFELPCKCFIFRCFPKYLDTPHPDICTCRCAECMAFELPCKCFIFRCFPKYLDKPQPDICTFKCAECLSCELPCKCFVTRCFPQYLTPTKYKWLECMCGECMKCERNCRCCILRCFPSLLHEDDYCTCTFRQCTACEKNFACFNCRCFPTVLDPSKPEVFECTCRKCLSCEKKISCCILRCCPNYLNPPKNDWCECLFGKNEIRPISIPIPRPILQPQALPPPRIRTPPIFIPVTYQPHPVSLISVSRPYPSNDILPETPTPRLEKSSCCCCFSTVKFPIRQIKPPMPTRIGTSSRKESSCCDCKSLPRIAALPHYECTCCENRLRTKFPRQRLQNPVCKELCGKIINVVLYIMIILIILLFLFYVFLEIVQVHYVLMCVVNDTLMNATQIIFVQNYLKLFKL